MFNPDEIDTDMDDDSMLADEQIVGFYPARFGSDQYYADYFDYFALYA